MIIDDVWKLIYSDSKSLSKIYWLNMHNFISASEIYSKHTVFITCQILYRYRYGYRYIQAPQVGLVVKNPPAKQSRRHKKHGFDSWTGEIPWRRAWQPTPVFLPGESHGQRSLVGWVHRVTKSQTQLKQLGMQPQRSKAIGLKSQSWCLTELELEPQLTDSRNHIRNYDALVSLLHRNKS